MQVPGIKTLHLSSLTYPAASSDVIASDAAKFLQQLVRDFYSVFRVFFFAIDQLEICCTLTVAPPLHRRGLSSEKPNDFIKRCIRNSRHLLSRFVMAIQLLTRTRRSPNFSGTCSDGATFAP